MNDRDFRKLKAGAARAALAVCGWLALALAAVGLVRAQETGGTNTQSGPVVTAYLDYHEVNYTFVQWGAPVVGKAPGFKKEPALSGGKVVRGSLQLGLGTGEEMGFVWDRTAGKLYLDLNRNLDLTDDPVWVCPHAQRNGDNYQSFTNIHLPFKTAAGNRPMLVDISLYDFGQLNFQVAMRSFWGGKVTLEGEEWQVGLLPGSPFNGQGSLEGGNLLLRPWAERSKPFNLYSGTLDAVGFSRKLYLGNRAYGLRCTNEVEGGAAKVRMEFTEESPKLGELKITGQFVERVTLEGGPYLVVLDRPEGTVKVPVGRYKEAKVYLKKGGAEAHLDGARAAAGKITVAEKGPAVLDVGGPLTNSVSISRGGRNLNLNYQLVGAGGAYQLVNQDRSHPPEFAVYQGDRKVGSGKFAFG